MGERKGAMMGKRALIYFPPLLNKHYAGIIDGYDLSKLDGNY